MKVSELLNGIYFENKAINRKLERLSNIALMGIVFKLSKSAEEKEDDRGKRICKIALVLLFISHVLNVFMEIADLFSQKESEKKADE